MSRLRGTGYCIIFHEKPPRCRLQKTFLSNACHHSSTRSVTHRSHRSAENMQPDPYRPEQETDHRAATTGRSATVSGRDYFLRRKGRETAHEPPFRTLVGIVFGEGNRALTGTSRKWAPEARGRRQRKAPRHLPGQPEHEWENFFRERMGREARTGPGQTLRIRGCTPGLRLKQAGGFRVRGRPRGVPQRAKYLPRSEKTSHIVDIADVILYF